jgi:hypothetical protein
MPWGHTSHFTLHTSHFTLHASHFTLHPTHTSHISHTSQKSYTSHTSQTSQTSQTSHISHTSQTSHIACEAQRLSVCGAPGVQTWAQLCKRWERGTKRDGGRHDHFKGKSCGVLSAGRLLRVCELASSRGAPHRTCAPTGGVLLMPWGRWEFVLFRSDSEEFLGCFFSFAGSPKHRLWAPGRRDCPFRLGGGDRRLGCATGEPGACGDSRITPCGCPVCGFTPREAVAMTMSCEWLAADPLDSADCPTFARGAPARCGGGCGAACCGGGGGGGFG